MAVGADGLAHAAGREWRRARQALTAGRYPAGCRRDLHAVVGELGEVTGWLLFDAGRPGLARRVLSDALLVSQSAGDNGMVQLQLSLLAMLDQQEGRFKAARVRAGRGLALGARGGRVEAMHRLRLGRALASLGSREGLTELDRAAVLLDHPRMDEPVWTWWLTGAELALHRGQAAGAVGDRTAAVELTRQAVDRLPATQPRDRAIYLVRHLRTAMAAGAWDAAGVAAGDLVAVCDQLRSGRLVTATRQALGQARRVSAPTAVVDTLHAVTG
ncbi:hypothetical protein [Plantactinospora sp. GCM10030261]|uniref:hypothetical protein n=1 Tax=Plantactinospora sp. GCM10030261 TaxID=3273420 RepID=UPI00360B295D